MAGLRVALGNPALFEDSGIEWAVFEDGRLNPNDLAYLSTAIKTPTLDRAGRKAVVDLDSWLHDHLTLDDVISAQGTSAVRANDARMKSKVPSVRDRR